MVKRISMREIIQERDPTSFHPRGGVDPKNNVGASNNFEEENPEVIKQNAILLRRNSIQSLFNGYNFDLKSSNAASNTTNTALSSARKSSGRQSLSSFIEAR